MSVRSLFLLATILVVISNQSAGGDIFKALVRDFREVNEWPCPYNCWDREAATASFPIMIQNGWRRQNLLADGHFTANNAELSPAGQYKVRWIVTEAPLQHRMIYVRRADNPDQTEARITAIRDFASKVAPDADPPSILETNLSPAGYPAGWPGAKDDSIARKFQTHMPDNLYLPDRNSGGGSSGN